jgi:pimeloyl-ACP methyl ester carboxylesterase
VPLLSMFDAANDIQAQLPNITCPLLLFSSPQDHVVPPGDSDYLVTQVSGPVERIGRRPGARWAGDLVEAADALTARL